MNSLSNQNFDLMDVTSSQQFGGSRGYAAAPQSQGYANQPNWVGSRTVDATLGQEIGSTPPFRGTQPGIAPRSSLPFQSLSDLPFDLEQIRQLAGQQRRGSRQNFGAGSNAGNFGGFSSVIQSQPQQSFQQQQQPQLQQSQGFGSSLLGQNDAFDALDNPFFAATQQQSPIASATRQNVGSIFGPSAAGGFNTAPAVLGGAQQQGSVQGYANRRQSSTRRQSGLYGQQQQNGLYGRQSSGYAGQYNQGNGLYNNGLAGYASSTRRQSANGNNRRQSGSLYGQSRRQSGSANNLYGRQSSNNYFQGQNGYDQGYFGNGQQGYNLDQGYDQF